MTSNSWQSYPSVHNLGSAPVKDLLTVPCYVEEKVDGSQFSFGVFDTEDGVLELRCRSKGAQIYPDAPPGMFSSVVATAKRLYSEGMLKTGWTYRGEALAKPKHNSLAYERVPHNNVVLYDVSVGDGEFLDRSQLEAEAARLDLEVVPLLLPHTPSLEEMRHLLDHQSALLGGQLIEGVVIKQQQPPYLLGMDKKPLIGKFVSERFREIHKQVWKTTNPTTGDAVERIAKAFCTEARWHKAVQRLLEAGELTHTPRDIGALIKSVGPDIQKECEDDIKQALWKAFWPQISRMATRGLPEWYKQQLLERQFTEDAETGEQPS